MSSRSLYKKPLKRSRSSIDAVGAHHEDILAVRSAKLGACRDVLGSQASEEGIHFHECCMIAELTHTSSFKSRMHQRPLVRASSCPSDCDKQLTGWCLNSIDSVQQEGIALRRKAGVRCKSDSANGDVGEFPCSASSPNLDVQSNESGAMRLLSRNAYDLLKNRPSGSCKRGLQVDPPDLCSDSSRNKELPSRPKVSGHGLNMKEESESDIVRKGCCIGSERCPQYGMLSVCGRRREMEDTCTAILDLVLLPCNSIGGCRGTDCASCICSSFHFFGIYDGHGGTQASRFCKARLHKVLTELLIKEVRWSKRPAKEHSNDWSARWRRIMEACFLRIDEEVGGVCPAGVCCTSTEDHSTCCASSIAPEGVGTTATVAIIGPCQLIVANCGDSRAILSRSGFVVPLSKDHKPDREDELNRIIAAGGRVVYWDGVRVGGLLAMSRAIGDRLLKNYVIAVPEVTCIERTKEDEFLILASDGLWDVISSEMACEIARKQLRLQRRKRAISENPNAEVLPAEAAAVLLTKAALSRGSEDNISVIVVDLKSYCKKKSVKAISV